MVFASKKRKRGWLVGRLPKRPRLADTHLEVTVKGHDWSNWVRVVEADDSAALVSKDCGHSATCMCGNSTPVGWYTSENCHVYIGTFTDKPQSTLTGSYNTQVHYTTVFPETAGEYMINFAVCWIRHFTVVCTGIIYKLAKSYHAFKQHYYCHMHKYKQILREFFYRVVKSSQGSMQRFGKWQGGEIQAMVIVGAISPQSELLCFVNCNCYLPCEWS